MAAPVAYVAAHTAQSTASSGIATFKLLEIYY